MNPTQQLIGMILGPILTFVAGIYVARQKARADGVDDRREDTTANDARWAAMLDSQRKDFDLILEPIRTELAGVKREVAEVRSELNIVRRVKDAAVDYARQLLTWARLVAPHETPPPVPALLADEV